MSDTIDSNVLERWRANPCAFIEQCLINPKTGEPFVLLDAERLFLQHALTLDVDGRLLYPELIYSCPKKGGKSTFAAIFVILLMMLYSGRRGEAICCANDLEQAQGRVYNAVKEIVEASPQLLAVARVTNDRITLADATIRAIPSSFASAAGSEQNIGVFDELWAVSSERARRLFDELVPIPTRRIACRLTVTHAGFENESTLLLELYKRGLQLPLVGKDLYAGNGMLMFWTHEPIASWQDEKWFSQMRRDLRPVQFLRMAENRFTSSENSFIDVASWDRCVDPALGHVPNNPALPVCVGLDASTKHDDTAVLAVNFDAKSQILRICTHRVFSPTPDQPIDFSLVEQELVDLSRRFRVVKILFDPFQFVSSAQRLTRLGLRLEEFQQTPNNLTEASTTLYKLIKSQSIISYPDAALRTAISNAIAVETPRGWRISKQTQTKKIDLAIALAMAAYGAVQSQNESLFVGFGENAHNWIDGPDLDAAPSDVAASAPDNPNQTYSELMANGGTTYQTHERWRKKFG